jgi:hypothetical protein
MAYTIITSHEYRKILERQSYNESRFFKILH